MKESSIKAGPDMAVSSMVPRPLDFGPAADAAGDTLERLEKWPLMRTAFLWMLFVAALAAIFWITR